MKKLRKELRNESCSLLTENAGMFTQMSVKKVYFTMLYSEYDKRPEKRRRG